MSKIAEKRTDEIVGEYHVGDYTDHSRHNTEWIAFEQGYDQAMQDFLEKARTWFFSDLYKYLVNSKEISIDEISRHFKNYMQNESN